MPVPRAACARALGGWALVLRYGSAIGPCDDRTALPDDMLASIGAGVAAVTLASVNIFGGFMVTRRMLAMYKKKER